MSYLFWLFFFFKDTPTTEIYTYVHPLSLHDALPIFLGGARYSYAAPFETIDVPWRVALAVSWSERLYVDPDVVVDPDRRRRDKEWQVSLNHSFRLANDLSIEGQVRYEDNDSNLSNYRYDNWSFTLGVLAVF